MGKREQYKEINEHGKKRRKRLKDKRLWWGIQRKKECKMKEKKKGKE